MRQINFSIILFFISNILNASLFVPQKDKSIFIKKTNQKITINGILDEPIWSETETASDFQQNFPFDTSYAITRTEVKVTYDDNFLYIAAICYDSLDGDYVIQTLKRDFSYPISDAFAVSIDPFNDKTSGFSFGVNPLGVQREGMIYWGGGMGVTTNWDNKWFSEVKIEKYKWIVEMAIPFKTLRFKENIKEWGINFSRNDLKRNESSTWCHVPRGFNIASLAYTGRLIWDNPPGKTGNNISVIPYTIANVNRDYINENKEKYNANIGLDAKIAITSSLNLDLTFNPDFSQVEVDRQVTNLTRFNLFFPEQRTFFLENSDIFERYGFTQIRPFFSRNIGLRNGEIIPIMGGARLSGRINKNWRTGIMNIQTAKKSSLNIQSQNYSVAAIQRDVFKRSNIAAIFVNRQGFIDKEINYTDFNRIVGLDYNLASANNKWLGKFFYHQALLPNQPVNAYANASFLLYTTPKITIAWNHEYVGKNYKADVGFVPRLSQYNPTTNSYETNTFWRLEPSVKYLFYPKSTLINNHGPEFYINQYYDENISTTDYLYLLTYYINFQNTSKISVNTSTNLTKLLYPTDVTFSGSTNALPIGIYKYENAGISYTSNIIKKTNGVITVNYGEYFTGKKFSLSGEIAYRHQPYGKFSLSFTTDQISLPFPYNSRTLYLFGQKTELTFSKNLFFTGFFQYNTQAKNFNINTRIKWRFKPMSDFYIVYSDNYTTDTFTQKNKALVIKFIYWINV